MANQLNEVIRDLVSRMTGGNNDVAAICAKAVAVVSGDNVGPIPDGENIEDAASGSVCIRVSPEEASALKDEPRIVATVGKDALPSDVETPFVLCGDLLYTRRNWFYERNVSQRVAEIAAVNPGTAGIPEQGGMRPEQFEAVKAMCRSNFSILTGGPGTGKTYTIAQAVKFLRESNPDLRLGLAAPTGKAAARMTESMRNAMDNVPEASTIHTLLGTNPDFVTFRHNRTNPLALDWLIIDEASMIDLPLMSKLLDALPSECRLTLVGDVNQLASVERGRVFGDLCAIAARSEGASLSALHQSMRFPPDGPIARLSDAVNGGDPDAAMSVIATAGELVEFHDLLAEDGRAPKEFTASVKAGFASLAGSRTPEDALRFLNDFRVLTALRHGHFGCESLNERIRREMGTDCPTPVMVTANNTILRVHNGDVGVVMPDDPKTLHLPCDGGSRAVSLALLPDTELAFASTIHKSQGSEFSDVAIVLPPSGESPLMTREILYTGITRTKKRVAIFAGEPAIRRCCEKKTERLSGLA